MSKTVQDVAFLDIIFVANSLLEVHLTSFQDQTQRWERKFHQSTNRSEAPAPLAQRISVPWMKASALPQNSRPAG